MAAEAPLERIDPLTRGMIQLGVVIVVVAALKLSVSVTLPLAFSVFLMALFWPLYRGVEAKAGGAAGAVTTLLVFLAVVGALGAALWLAGAQVAEKAPQYEGRVDQMLAQLRSTAEAYGLPAPGGGGGSALGSLGASLKGAATAVLGTIGGFVLVIAFLVLGLLEVHAFRRKVAGTVDDEGEFERVVRRVAGDFQRYILIRTATGLFTGVLVGLGSWAVGLEFALAWGLMNFLLNYIPTLGSIVAVVPPVLFALAQFESFGMALLTFGVVGGAQLLVGSYIDPLVQGRFLQLSALVVLLSVAFWGFVWGAMGALISVPITIVVVLVTREFDRTRWIARLLASEEAEI